MARKIRKFIKRCVRCNEQLTAFAGFIPGKGEACLKCFNEYAINEEKI